MYKRRSIVAALILACSLSVTVARAQTLLDTTIFGGALGEASNESRTEEEQDLGGGRLFGTPGGAPSTAISTKGNGVQESSGDDLGNRIKSGGKLAIGTPRFDSDYPTDAFGLPVPPFGINLFRGQFVAEREDSLNPDYVVGIGDRIAIRMWGAKTFNGVLSVDIQGNVFLPDIGPARVAGVKNKSIFAAIERKIKSVFKNSVEIYVNLLSSQPVGVYVSGYVRSPGRYAGVPTDSLLYFLDRAGGIDAKRGSFRNVTVFRDKQQIATADLYGFLLNGDLPRIQFEDGDTVIVNKRLGTVRAEGAVRNEAVYELIGGAKVTGKLLSDLVSPDPEASHVALSGMRGGKPMNVYLPLADFMKVELGSGDVARYISDQKADRIFVNINGEYQGPGIYSVAQGTRIKDVLNLVEINPAVANPDAIFLMRRSVARDQKLAIENSLAQLERSVLTSFSPSDGVASIRSAEAELVLKFIERARQVTPEGRVVISHQGELANVMLEKDDIIVVPRRSDIIQVSGEVTVPQALVYAPDLGIDDYVALSGGYTDRADEDNIMVIRQSGEIVGAGAGPLLPGDQIFILPEVDEKTFQIGKELLQAIYQIVVASAVLVTL